MRRHIHGAQVFRITGARAGLSADVRGRQRRYVISMTIRTVCFLLAVLLWNISTPLAWAALVAGAVLPYIAVVIANAGRENSVSLPSTLLPPRERPVLEGRIQQGPAPEAEPEPEPEKEHH